MRIGLTGGIGSGKSTVSARLAQLGAEVIDADLIARAVVEPNTPGLAQIRQEFGDAVISADGSLNRPALGAIVFADADRRRALEAITHPLIAAETAARFAAADAEAVVVHDMPLLVETGQTDGYHLMVIVDVPEELRVRRLVELRGMSDADARSRIAAQASDEQRRAAADVLVDNSGARENLDEAVDRLWAERITPYASNLAADRGVRRPDGVRLVPSDPRWQHRAQRLTARIRWQLAAAGFDPMPVDHIGSTAVPGLAAKDVLDLQLQVPELAVAQQDSFRAALRAAGIVELRANADEPKPWAPDPQEWRKFYANGADPEQVVHLHIRQAGGPGAQIALQFRDWLRAEPSERAAYEAMKRDAAQQHPGGSTETKQDYVAAKEPWFDINLPRARQWALSRPV
ncbi:dephospho-CoA kinase [Calidifontibacter terrae]